jgi:hypothetical protein
MDIKVDVNIVVHIHPPGGGAATNADLAGFVQALNDIAASIPNISAPKG